MHNKKKLYTVSIWKTALFSSLTCVYFISYQDFHTFILQCFPFYLRPCLMLDNYNAIICLHFTTFFFFFHFTFYVEWHIWVFWKFIKTSRAHIFCIFSLYQGALLLLLKYLLNIFYIANSGYSYFFCQTCHYAYSLSICKFVFSTPCNCILLC